MVFVVMALCLPFQIAMGKLGGNIIQKRNVYKDRRVKTCTEIIEGIKFIKLYGWEIAFKHMIQTLRKEEIRNYLKLALIQSVERALGNVVPHIAGFTCFLVMGLS